MRGMQGRVGKVMAVTGECARCLSLCSDNSHSNGPGCSCRAARAHPMCSSICLRSPRYLRRASVLSNSALPCTTCAHRHNEFQRWKVQIGTIPSILGLPRLMVVRLSHLQTHGISRPALVSRGASSSVDRHVREGPTFCILYSVFCILSCCCGGFYGTEETVSTVRRSTVGIAIPSASARLLAETSAVRGRWVAVALYTRLPSRCQLPSLPARGAQRATASGPDRTRRMMDARSKTGTITAAVATRLNMTLARSPSCPSTQMQPVSWSTRAAAFRAAPAVRLR